MMLCTPRYPLALWLHGYDLTALTVHLPWRLLVFLERNLSLVCMYAKPFFPHRPNKASVVLLPIYEFLFPNPIFSSVLIEQLSSSLSEATVHNGPLSCAIILSFASYLCSDSHRPIAYATLSLNVLLAFVENDQTFCVAKILLQSGYRLSFWHYFNSWLKYLREYWLLPLPPQASGTTSCLLNFGLLCTMAASQPSKARYWVVWFLQDHIHLAALTEILM